MHVDAVLWAEGAMATAMRKLHTEAELEVWNCVAGCSTEGSRGPFVQQLDTRLYRNLRPRHPCGLRSHGQPPPYKPYRGSGGPLPARQSAKSAKSANLAHCMNFPARSRVVSRKSRVVTADLRKSQSQMSTTPPEKLLCDAYYRAASRQALPYNYPIH
ncbi:hypothetical protein E4U23_004241 [Claviceps purpurea]|nr:hypothetical protein E4U23_004241 [Claviceps purpurea]